MKRKKIKETQKFVRVGAEKIDVSITQPTGRSIGSALFLHGAGESSKDRCLPLARELSARGYSCLTFSFPGHGNSSGTLLGSTLAGRKKIAVELASLLGYFPATMIVGVSMGGYTAASMLKENPEAFERMALFVPAAYAREAEEVPFGPMFTSVLKTPGSYLDSYVWELLPKFTGKFALISAGQDKIIPLVVTKMYKKNAANAAENVSVTIKRSPHQITVWMASEESRLHALAYGLDRFEFGDLNELD